MSERTPPTTNSFAALGHVLENENLVDLQPGSDSSAARAIAFSFGGQDVKLHLRVLHAAVELDPETAQDRNLGDTPAHGDLLEIIAIADLPDGLGLGNILGAFAELFGGAPPDLPDWLTSSAAPRLETLGLRFDGDLTLAQVSARIGVGSVARFDIVPDLIGVEDLALELSVAYPFDDMRAEISLTATGGIGLGAARVQARVEARDTTLLRKDIPAPPADTSQALADEMFGELPATEEATEGSPVAEPPSDETFTAEFQQALQPPDTAHKVFSHLTVSGWLEYEMSLADLATSFGLDGASLGVGAALSDGKFQYISETGAYALAMTLTGARRPDTDETGPTEIFDPFDPDPLVLRPTRLPLFELPGGLTLTEAMLHIGGSTEAGDFYAQISAAMQLGSAQIHVTASYNSSTSGLFFEGQWTQANIPRPAIDFGTDPTLNAPAGKDPAGFTTFLEGTLHLTIPEPLQDIEVHAIDLQIDTGKQSLVFDVDVGLPFKPFSDKPATPIDARLHIEAHREADSYTGKFHGVIAVGDPEDPWELDMLIARSETQTAFVAGYRVDPDVGAETGQSVGALAAALQLGEEIGTLDVIVREAVFAVSKGDAEAAGNGAPEEDPQSEFLFSADVEAGLDLTRIELPGLPILGALGLAGPDVLRLRVMVAYASAGADEALAALAVEAGFHPPDPLSTGFQIIPLLQVGDRILTVGPSGQGDAEETPSTATKPIETKELAPPFADAIAETTPSALGDEAQWIDVQRAFGPVRVRRVGVALHRPENGDPSEVRGFIDASMEMAGLTVSLDGLCVSAALGDMVPHFSIDGLGIDYHGGIEIGGALLKRDGTFAGELIASSGPFSLSAVGLYEAHEEVSSFMAHAVVDYPIGGPAFFFVTGFAAGFGINRGVVMPEPAAIGTFPLIAQARSPAPPGQFRESRLTALSSIRDALPFHAGAHFISAGVQFNSFKTIDSVALLIVIFGEQLAFKLLGESILSSPPKETKAPPLAYAQLTWDAEFTPDEGTLKLDATLAPESFVLDRNCKLHGGMAFRAWFKTPPHVTADGPHEGEFVLTIGGYHPNFHAPAYFPRVDDVGFDWEVNENLTIKGSAYFALTGGAIMAGGALDSTWACGDVKVTFHAEADFLIAWRPHHYDIHMRVQIDGEVTVHFLGAHTLELHASADLHLWGPDFAGRGTVHVSILGYDVDFSIAFNDSAKLSQAISWEDFTAELLPAKILTLAPAGGQLAEIPGTPLRFDRRDLRLRVETAIPFTKTQGAPTPAQGDALGVYPCGETDWQSTFSLEITDKSGASKTDAFDVKLITDALPAALWGRPKAIAFYGSKTISPPSANGPRMIRDAPKGVEITVRPSLDAKDQNRPATAPPADAIEVLERQIKVKGGTSGASAPPAAVMSFDDRAQMLRALGFATHRLAQGQNARSTNTETA